MTPSHELAFQIKQGKANELRNLSAAERCAGARLTTSSRAPSFINVEDQK
jgi:hypothetical protein